MKGQCLCGGVEFEVHDAPHKLYQCHCSLCRKQSGTASNAAFIVPREKVSWHAGRDLVTSFTRPTGFRSDFCSRCGSPVPNVVGHTAYVWVPAGLLDPSAELEVAMHLWLDSKVAWEAMPAGGVHHAAAPSFDEIVAFLHE